MKKQQRIIIYGDSFCDPQYSKKSNLERSIHPTENPWYDQLSEHAHVTNRGFEGTGIFRVMRHFFNDVKKYHNYQLSVVLILSYHTRFDFPGNPEASKYIKTNCMSPDDIDFILPDGRPNSFGVGMTKENTDRLYNWWRENETPCHRVHEYLHGVQQHMTDMFFSWVANWTQQHEGKKAICISVPAYNNRYRSNLDTPISPLSHDNFYYNPRFSLAQVHTEEFTEQGTFFMEEKRPGYDFEGRRNHMSTCNHDILYRNIKKFLIDGDNELDWNFYKHFYEGPLEEYCTKGKGPTSIQSLTQKG